MRWTVVLVIGPGIILALLALLLDPGDCFILNTELHESEYIEELNEVVKVRYPDQPVLHRRKRYASVIAERCLDSPEYHVCNNTRQCIRSAYICDGDNDCPEADDEFNCTSYQCPEHSVKCTDTGVCVRQDKVCDGCLDCENGDDERNCTSKSCTGAQFWCMSTNDCIPLVWICDGTTQCPNSEDELCDVQRKAEVLELLDKDQNLTFGIKGQSIRNGSDIMGIIYKEWKVTAPKGLHLYAAVTDLSLGPGCGPTTLSLYSGKEKAAQLCGDDTPTWSIRSIDNMFIVSLLYFGFDGQDRSFEINFKIDHYYDKKLIG